MTRKKTAPEETEKRFPGEIRESDQASITITRAEVKALTNAAQALDLMGACYEADSDMPIGHLGILIDLTANPAWEAANEIENRFNEARGDTA